jgi:hypothetical protein
MKKSSGGSGGSLKVLLSLRDVSVAISNLKELAALPGLVRQRKTILSTAGKMEELFACCHAFGKEVTVLESQVRVQKVIIYSFLTAFTVGVVAGVILVYLRMI